MGSTNIKNKQTVEKQPIKAANEPSINQKQPVITDPVVTYCQNLENILN